MASASPLLPPTKALSGRVTLIKKRTISPDAKPLLPTAEEQQQVDAKRARIGGEDWPLPGAPLGVASSTMASIAHADSRPVYYGCLRKLIPEDWANALRDMHVFDSDMMDSLERRYYSETQDEPKKRVFPERIDIFRALTLCPLARVRVVLIGQDPYYNDGQAMGIAFSVKRGVRVPPSLQNIYKEIAAEYGGDFKIPEHGDLTHWAEQGVLLLNSSLTVRAGEPAAHANWEWQEFTDRLVEIVSKRHQNIVFLLWGAHAQNKAAKIQGHYKLKTSHPSPNSVEKGFEGCGHFKECNLMLARHGHAPIEWGTRLNGSPLPRPQKDVVTMANFVRVIKRPFSTSPPTSDATVLPRAGSDSALPRAADNKE